VKPEGSRGQKSGCLLLRRGGMPFFHEVLAVEQTDGVIAGDRRQHAGLSQSFDGWLTCSGVGRGLRRRCRDALSVPRTHEQARKRRLPADLLCVEVCCSLLLEPGCAE